MSRWLPHPILLVTMVVVWGLLFDSFAFGVLLLGAVLSTLIIYWAGAFWPDRVRLRRPLTILRLGLIVLWDIIIANIAVARLVLSPLIRLHPGFLVVPLDVRDPYAIVALTGIITMTPGTVSCLLSADRRTLYVHAIDASEPEDAVREIKQRYEAPLKEIFE